MIYAQHIDAVKNQLLDDEMMNCTQLPVVMDHGKAGTQPCFHLEGFVSSCTMHRPAGTSPLQSHPPPPATPPLQRDRQRKAGLSINLSWFSNTTNTSTPAFTLFQR